MSKNPSDDFEFGAWKTPFEGEWVEILDCIYSGASNLLTIRVETNGGFTFRIHAEIAAFRVQDEGGLLEFWQKAEELRTRPALATFKVRNSQWAKESIVPFLGSDGWSYVLATQSTCFDFCTFGDAIPIVTAE